MSNGVWVKELRGIVTRYGGRASDEEIHGAFRRAIAQAQTGGSENLDDQDILRIRLSKFIASKIPADVYADRLQRAEIRQALRTLIDDLTMESPTQPNLLSS